ncbi:carbonic anhydrase [Rhizobium leguminosarum]|uniref:carbonic anhydrase n=2 Tax=Rhizobium leguminosarum TaxID=384 RepID=UPI001FE0175C|nr:carbonic anhydrase [Rhizobium leguminosarum]
MGDLLKGISSFRGAVFPSHSALYRKLAREGQQPHALMISCADSRVMPETITQSGPGDLFVCRNAGNIVPPFSTLNGGVSSAIEYAILALGVSDIVVCGHSDCGAMKGLCHPEMLVPMPNVAAWLRHSHAASNVIEIASDPKFARRNAAPGPQQRNGVRGAPIQGNDRQIALRRLGLRLKHAGILRGVSLRQHEVPSRATAFVKLFSSATARKASGRQFFALHSLILDIGSMTYQCLIERNGEDYLPYKGDTGAAR